MTIFTGSDRPCERCKTGFILFVLLDMTDRFAVPEELIIPSLSPWQVLGNHPSLLFHHSANHQKKMAPIHQIEIARYCLSIICHPNKLCIWRYWRTKISANISWLIRNNERRLNFTYFWWACSVTLEELKFQKIGAKIENRGIEFLLCKIPIYNLILRLTKKTS